MLTEIEELRSVIAEDLTRITTAEELEAFRLKHLVRKGTLAALADAFKNVPKDEKPVIGKNLNALRQYVQSQFAGLRAEFEAQSQKSTDLDLTLPGRAGFEGSLHPIEQTLSEIRSIFGRLGFAVADGPEIENDYHNFEALNFPPDHPARDMQDTFFVDSERDDILLRTHTSSVQIRLMHQKKPPIRTIIPGRVYRNEALDATHLAEFYQVEGLYVDTNVSFAELKGTLTSFFSALLKEQNIEFRFRPSFFPFTEPSAEMDMRYVYANGERSKWLEACGCGMVHPNVLRNCDIDPEEFAGYAFGFGVERIAMMRFGFDNIRMLYQNDIRLLRQF